jgi:hypothetical protein
VEVGMVRVKMVLAQEMVLVREMDMEIALGTVRVRDRVMVMGMVRVRDREMVLGMVRTKIDREEGFEALANC